MNDEPNVAAQPYEVSSKWPEDDSGKADFRYDAPKSPSSSPIVRDGRINGISINGSNGTSNVEKSDSEAETVVSSGKKEDQERKVKKAIKLEEVGGLESIATHKSNEISVDRNGQREEAAQNNNRQGSLKRKRRILDDGNDQNSRDTSSSNLSSTISSPVQEARSSKATDTPSNRSRSSPPIDDVTYRHEKPAANDPGAEDNNVRTHRQRDRNDKGPEPVTARKRRDTRSATHYDGPTHRSESPPSRNNTRAQSIHSTLPPSGVTKRRKAPAPLHVDRPRKTSEDTHPDSDDDSSIHSHHNAHKISSVDNSILSPAKMVSHKKNRDRNGRTLLARACAQGVKEAEQWLKERPQDLDVPDNAGNTPLQIAALEGDVEVVQLLLEAGCDITCRNIDKDTPLIDAIENGHLKVVKILLKAGLDPRQTNAKGAEPIDLVPADDEDADEIREALSASKKERSAVRRPSEDNRLHGIGSKDVDMAAPSAPGLSPVNSNRSPPPPGPGARRRTARSQPTDDHLLWVNPTPARLRDAAGKGDLTIVDHILKMRPEADTESIIAAARGGHDAVLDVMLAIARHDPDPEPLKSGDYKPAYSTPMLAAIGRGNVNIINLLLSQPGFDPTRRRYKGMTYFDIARDRQGSEWQEEHEVLKEAYETFKRTGGRKSNNNSPRKARPKRADSTKSSSELSSSPHEIRKPKKPSILKEESIDGNKRDASLAGGRKHRSPALASDHDSEALGPPKVKVKPIKSGDKIPSPLPSRRTEGLKPKSRLMSGNEIKRDKEIKRRASLAAEADLVKRPSNESIPGNIARQRRLSEAAESKLPAMHGEVSSVKSEIGKKRHRLSVSPQASKSDFGIGSDILKMKKRQRVNSQGSAADPISNRSFPSGLPAMVANMIANPSTATSPTISLGTAPIAFMGNNTSNPSTEPREESEHSAPAPPDNSTNQVPLLRSDKQGVHSQHFVDDDRVSQGHGGQSCGSEVNGYHEKAFLEDDRQQQLELERRQIAQAQRDDIERKAQVERAETERKAQVAREEELARQRSLEIERQAQLQMEREYEIARIAKLKRDEEANQRRLEQERIKREEQERRRRELDELRQQRLKEEEDRRRLAALPNGLRRCATQNPEAAKSQRWVTQWMPLYTVYTQQLNPLCDPQVAQEKWVANVQVAPILAITDLNLSQCMCTHCCYLVCIVC